MYSNRYKCEHCGANLDPAENCTCQEERTQKEKDIFSVISLETDGQYVLSEAVS